MNNNFENNLELLELINRKNLYSTCRYRPTNVYCMVYIFYDMHAD